jgi:hypothetical protein
MFPVPLQSFSLENAPIPVIASPAKTRNTNCSCHCEQNEAISLPCPEIASSLAYGELLKDIFLVLCVSLRHVGFTRKSPFDRRDARPTVLYSQLLHGTDALAVYNTGL